MSTEVLPVGISCNLRCTYCYEQNLRDKNPAEKYQRDAVMASVAKLTEDFSLFGGECLILPLDKLEELLKASFDRWGKSGMQTNGSLITEKHIDLFRKYQTHVGISVDGPDDLNDSRWAGTLEATRKQTAKSHWAIQRLSKESQTYPWLMPSIITTLHAGNASRERWPRLIRWFHELDGMGIQHMNLHVMELDSKADTLYLSQDELADRLIDLWRIATTFTNLKFTKFAEVLQVLQGEDEHVCCNWRACDPNNTSAVTSIEHDGSPTKCARTFKGEQRWLPAEGTGSNAEFIGHPGARYHERQLALYNSPQDVGGCQGCPYWLCCYGSCPGEGEHGDWRMRSHYCPTYKKLFAEGERILRLQNIVPLSQSPDRPELEKRMYYMMATGQNTTLKWLRSTLNVASPQEACHQTKPGHGDHTDHQHGDKPHGDHYDAQKS